MRIISRVINVRVPTKTRNKAPIFAKLEFARLSLSKKEKKKKKKRNANAFVSHAIWAFYNRYSSSPFTPFFSFPTRPPPFHLSQLEKMPGY